MKKKIIYIMGAGRSGTTLLDILLGNGDNFFSAGELNRFPVREGISPLSKDLNPEPWEVIRRTLFSRFSSGDFKQLKEIVKKYEYHSYFFGLRDGKSKATYLRYLVDFFQSLDGLVKEEYILDSSKYPARALHLSRIFGDRISYIHLVRNPDMVIESFAKKGIEQPSKGPLMANLYYHLVNKLCFRVIKKLGRGHKVTVLSFDDFVDNPLHALDTLEAKLEIDLTSQKEVIKNNMPLDVGCLFDGNRIAKKKQVVLSKSRTETKSHLLTQFINTNLYKKIINHEY